MQIQFYEVLDNGKNFFRIICLSLCFLIVNQFFATYFDLVGIIVRVWFLELHKSRKFLLIALSLLFLFVTLDFYAFNVEYCNACMCNDVLPRRFIDIMQ